MKGDTAEIIEALKQTTVSLIAAVSLLERGGRKAAPSDKMFAAMIEDYKKAIETGRKALVTEKHWSAQS